MQIAPIKSYVNKIQTGSENKPSFGHGNESFWKSDYTKGQKWTVAGTTAVGVLSSLAIMAKIKGHTMKPKDLLKYFKEADFLFKEIVAMGIGTCLGGLAGGYIIDKNPENRKAKRREAVMQIGNISIPIGTVAAANLLCEKFAPKGRNGKITKAVASVGAIIGGIYLANFSMNKLSNWIFKNKTEERDVKATDLSPHLDDVLASAKYVAPQSKAVHYVSRIVPLALMVAGNEIGNKKASLNTSL